MCKQDGQIVWTDKISVEKKILIFSMYFLHDINILLTPWNILIQTGACVLKSDLNVHCSFLVFWEGGVLSFVIFSNVKVK